MRKRKQNGTIIRIGDQWYVRYWERRNVGGSIERKRVTHVLGEVTTRGKYVPPAIKDAAEEHMRSVNSNRVEAGKIISVVAFSEQIYLPWVKEQKRPATYNGYHKIWKKHLRVHFGSSFLHEYKPSQATQFLTELARNNMGRHTVAHVRSLMSGIFSHALALGYVTMNPIHDSKLMVAAKAPQETPHYTISEMISILSVLQGDSQARVAMALAFIGLRPSEIRGLRWEDVETGILHIRRSAWRSTLREGGKGRNSVRDVTLGPAVADILEAHRQSSVSRSGFILENTRGRPLDLYALARDVIRPALVKAGVAWKGYYGGRRGAETEMNRYTNGNSQVTSHHFGHTKAVADAHYVKPLPEETKVAALQLDRALSGITGHLQDTRLYSA
jgi:integrase